MDGHITRWSTAWWTGALLVGSGVGSGVGLGGCHAPETSTPRADVTSAPVRDPSPPEIVTSDPLPPVDLPPAPEVQRVGPCKTPRPEATRRGGDLVVSSPPSRANEGEFSGLRLRTQVRGSLTLRAQRTWVGIEVPTFVVLAAGNRELFLMDETADGLFALYREPYGGQTCQIGARTNCSYGVVMYTCDGTTRWKLLVDKYFSRPDQLEIQDIRYANGTLYFNEACQETSKVAGGKCSSLVALDPVKEEVLWRTGPLVSNGVIQIADRYVIATYGFSGESSSVSLVRRSDGKVMQKLSLPSHATIQVSLSTSGVLTIPMGDGSILDVKVEGLDGDTPSLKKGKLTPAPKKPPPPPPPPPRPTRPRLPIDF